MADLGTNQPGLREVETHLYTKSDLWKWESVQKWQTNACKTNDYVDRLDLSTGGRQAGGACIHAGRLLLTSMIYEAEETGTKKLVGNLLLL